MSQYSRWPTNSGGGSGTVTSVAFSDATGTFTITGSPITTNGTLTLSAFASQSANTFLAAPNGAPGAPSFRAVLAADIPTLNQNTTGTASNVTGTVAIAHGGTGQVTAAAAYNALSPMTTTGDIEYESGANTASRLAIGSTGNVLTVAGGVPVWAAPATSGTVTSVAMTVPAFLSVAGSPISSSGTLAVTLSGTALPITNGGTGQTTAAAAYNALSPMTTTGDIEYESGANTASRLAIGSTGNVLTVAGGVPTWAAPATSGTVTSVALADSTGTFTITGSPVSSSGTLTLSAFASQTQNRFLASPNGSSGAPSFRAVVAADIPTLNQNTTGTASNVTGIVALVNGGTGTAAASANAAFNALSPMTTLGDVIYGGASGAGTRLGVGSTGNVLTVSGGVPVWSAPATNGTVTSVALSDASTAPIYSVSGSPVTTSGTLTLTLGTQSANTVFSGPSSGSAAQPTFRALVAADIPAPTIRTVTSTGNINASDSYNVILLNQAGNITLTLPAHVTGQVFTLKDTTGNAQTNQVTLARNGGSGNFENIAASYVFQTNYGSIKILDDGTNYWLM